MSPDAVSPHGRPTAAELVESVREWLEHDVSPATDGRLRFHARVAANVLAMVERELHLGQVHAARHHERLVALGCSDDVDLAEHIRTGDLDDRLDEVRALVFESVLDRLAVANPGYVVPDDAP